MVGVRRWTNRGRKGEVKTHRVESQSEEKETEPDASATWTGEDRTKGGRREGRERRIGREGIDSTEREHTFQQ